MAANQWGRFAALVLLALFGISLVLPQLADRMTRPIVALGNRLAVSAEGETLGRSGIAPSALLGVATGLLWAPCAGPILGLILTGAALQGANLQTSLLLGAYALGATTSLAFALLVGGRVFALMKRSLGIGEWVRRGLGVAVLAAVAGIALGVDTGFLSRVSAASTASLEQGLLDRLHVVGAQPNEAAAGDGGVVKKASLAVEGQLPSLDGAVQWLNSKPLSTADLKGKVVLVDFWTYSCINCLRTLPYIRAWAEKYKDKGLVVIGVHTPEFAFEKDTDNVVKAIKELKIDYPVAIDNNYAVWRAFNNMYWPAHYFIDAKGQIRHHHFGEGDYHGAERVIQQLLAEAGEDHVPGGLVNVQGSGATAAADSTDTRSPETYIGYERAENFASPEEPLQDQKQTYSAGSPRLNEWGLSGSWTIGDEQATADMSGAGIVYRFHARDLHLVLGPGEAGKPIHFKVTIDGMAPGQDHGSDTDAEGNGAVMDQRLYQLVRQTGPIRDRTFEIHFSDPGVRAYAFTFG